MLGSTEEPATNIGDPHKIGKPRLDSPHHEGLPDGNNSIKLPQHHMEGPIGNHSNQNDGCMGKDQYMSSARKGIGNHEAASWSNT